MKVFVLGHKGMLGHVTALYLKQKGHEVLTTDKRFEVSSDCQLLREIRQSDADIIVNCIGRIRQKTSDPTSLFFANAIFPIQLLQSLTPTQKMIQISSDCVFSGKKQSSYDIDAKPDPIDLYGVSKAVGEIIALDSRVILLRTSIIGPELSASFGLFSWFQKNASNVLSGYTDHLWNGVTTLQLSKVIEEYICEKRTDKKVHVASSNTLSKYELLKAINTVFDLKKHVKPIQTENPVNHALHSDVYEPTIETQLIELKEWYKIS